MWAELGIVSLKITHQSEGIVKNAASLISG